MIRKMITILFAITIFFSMTTVVMADSFQINSDKNVASVGEMISVKVSLDETLTGQFRNVQGQLRYDAELLTYLSHESSDLYTDYIFADMIERQYFTFTNTDFTDEGFSEIAKGNVVTVKFKVNESATGAHPRTALSLTVNVQDVKGESKDLTASTSVVICNERVETEDCQKTVCEKCGQEYAITDKPGDVSMKNNEGSEEGRSEGGRADTLKSLQIAAIVTAVAVICVFVLFRKKYKK